MALTYSSYLQLDQLLQLQQPRPGELEHDEMLFIIIHQVYELWFKEVLHEMDYLCTLLYANDTWRSLHTVRRVLTILKTLVAQIDVLETMTPLEFLSFRDRLETGSGFQSFQFRELEYVLGYKRREVMQNYPTGSEHWQRLERRFNQPGLWEAFLHFLQANGHPVPADQLGRDPRSSIQPSVEVQKVLIALYRSDTASARVCERLVDVDEGFQEWRYRHVKMVERTIGAKQGTGGSSGVGYLSQTLSKPFFPDLWAIRTEL